MKEFFNRLEKSWREYVIKRKKDNARRKLKNEQKMELS
jgi:hypothetical protein